MNVRIPDLRHQEQISLVLLYVVNTKKEMVTNNVIGFKLIHEQNGRGGKYILLAAVYEFGFNISSFRGQGYDNRENMSHKY
jgi:hypothetical protein